ncbi:MAG: hypothetical protein QUV06_07410 [Cyanobium sp. CZS 48M]|nr:hypothetical protein [Cyanobium sp. CZS48M]
MRSDLVPQPLWTSTPLQQQPPQAQSQGSAAQRQKLTPPPQARRA